jgi:hypothetical protein
MIFILAMIYLGRAAVYLTSVGQGWGGLDKASGLAPDQAVSGVGQQRKYCLETPLLQSR